QRAEQGPWAELHALLGGGHVPDAQVSLAVAGDDRLAVPRTGGGQEEGAVAGQMAELFAGAVPQRQAVAAGGRDEIAFRGRREAHGGLALERLQRVNGGQLPAEDLAVAGPQEHLAVGRELQAHVAAEVLGDKAARAAGAAGATRGLVRCVITAD